MDDPRSVHVWLPGGRSLCDRVKLTNALAGGEISVADPACSACMLLVSFIRRRAAATLKLAAGVWPSRPSDAWELLRGTRWETELGLDLDEFAGRTDIVNAAARIDAFIDQIDAESVDRVIDEWQAKR